MENKRKFDYKWVIVCASFVVVMITLGFANGTKGHFLGPVSSALGVERSIYAINDSIRFITTAVANLFFGTLVNKFGPKKLICAGTISLSLGLLIYSVSTSIFITYIGGFLLGIGFGWTGTSMVGILINRWCKENKGTIMGFVMASSGIGGAISTQVVSPIIEMDKANESFRIAYLVCAAIVFSVFFIALIFIKDAPEGAEIQPITGGKKKGKRGNDWVGIDFDEAKKLPYFWSFLVLIFLTGLVLQGVTGIALPAIKDTGMDPQYVANVWSIHSLCLFCAKFLIGFVYDRCGLRTTINICYITGGVMMVVLFSMANTPTGMILAAIYSVFSCVALPLETILLPIYASDLFGQKMYDKVLGIIVACNTAGYAVGTPIANISYDLTGSYKLTAIVSAILMLVILIGVHFVISAAHKKQKEIEAELAAVEEANAVLEEA